jgi:hypothetical protein
VQWPRRAGAADHSGVAEEALCSVAEEVRAERLKNRPGKVIPPHIDRHMVADLMSGTDGEFGVFWDSAEGFVRFALPALFGDG